MNIKVPIKEIRKDAEQGNPIAQCNLGCCYYNGWVVSQDNNEAVKWFQKSAAQGNDDAQINLGICYYYGYGVSQDWNKAIKWLEKSAEKGYAEAQGYLGIVYESMKQGDMALYWYEKAYQNKDTLNDSLKISIEMSIRRLEEVCCSSSRVVNIMNSKL
jgi:TPR repeat protein